LEGPRTFKSASQRSKRTEDEKKRELGVAKLADRVVVLSFIVSREFSLEVFIIKRVSYRVVSRK